MADDMKKVLIIAGGLQLGGAERVAANISKYAPPDEFEFHYVVFEGIENLYGSEIEKRGGRVFTIPAPGKGYFQYVRVLEKLIRENRYVAVHSHTMFNSGINLLVARLCGVPCRIAHSHTTKTEIPVSCKQKIYEMGMRILIRLTATGLMACGTEAGYWMFGRKAFDKKGIVIRNGIDTDEYSWSQKKRNDIRSMIGMENAFVIGHSGTLNPLKNQIFLIRLMPEILKRRPEATLVLLGSGTEEYQMELVSETQKNGTQDSVFFAGAVHNVAEYLCAFDVFAFPSLREGTPLALLEAQANGLPCVISDRIPKDVYLTDLITPLSLSSKEWPQYLCNAKRNGERYERIVKKLGYDAMQAYLPIYAAYRGGQS